MHKKLMVQPVLNKSIADKVRQSTELAQKEMKESKVVPVNTSSVCMFSGFYALISFSAQKRAKNLDGSYSPRPFDGSIGESVSVGTAASSSGPPLSRADVRHKLIYVLAPRSLTLNQLTKQLPTSTSSSDISSVLKDVSLSLSNHSHCSDC